MQVKATAATKMSKDLGKIHTKHTRLTTAGIITKHLNFDKSEQMSDIFPHHYLVLMHLV